jgi:large subunit ribosomal protein L33
LTEAFVYDIVDRRHEIYVFFLCKKICKYVCISYILCKTVKTHGGKIMRTRITLACTDCKNRNYDTTKDKKTHPDRVEMKKYCPFCKKHTLHKETK